MRKLCVMGVVVAMVAVSAGSALAAGFALIEQSVKGLGTAFSGGAAVADDPSTVYFNPAGMTRLEGQQATAAVHYVMPSAEFKNGAATTADGATISGANGDSHKDVGNDSVVPNAYYTLNMGEWAFGFGINVPFGLTTKHPADWIGRYHAVESDLLTINLNPSVAYKVSDQFSVGLGVSAQYLEATLSSMIDAGFLTSGPPPTGAATGLADVYSELTADNWAYGYNFGVLFEPSKSTRFGLSYRSKVKHDVDGDATFRGTNALSNALVGTPGLFPNQGASTEIELPASAQISVYQELTSNWAVMADIMWTEWSSFDKLLIEFDQGLLGGAVSSSLTTENWEDSWRYSLGTTFSPVEPLSIRCGFAYDETPIPDEHRTPRIPGADRYWLALGAGYQMKAWSFDIGYAHLFVDDGDVNLTTAYNPADENFSRGNLSGTFENSVDIFSVEASLKF